jgi:hypothetical protein
MICSYSAADTVEQSRYQKPFIACLAFRLRTVFFFNACILRYYFSQPLTSLSCSLNAVFPGLKMWDTFSCATAIFLTYFIISIAVLENVPPGAGLQKRATFSTLNVGLAWTFESNPGHLRGKHAAAALTAKPSTTPDIAYCTCS